jgi:glycosyltransferase involved in cell wall biosynthesis
MRALILAAGRFGDALKQDIARGREPRLDVFEIAKALGADVMDFGDVESSRRPVLRAASRGLGKSAALALLGFRERSRYDVIFTTGEDIGIPLAALLGATRARCAHAMIAHTLAPTKKRVFFKGGLVRQHIDRMLVYSTTEERLAIDGLGFSERHVERIYYHADEMFFKPDGRASEPDLVCSAGQLLRDYDCLIEAVRDLPVRVQIAAGSPWIDHSLAPKAALPENVSWGKLGRFELRELYARSAFAVVPIKQNVYQTGIATILEMMAMGKCIIATRTHGQTDTIVDDETGVYVPPGDPRALRRAIEALRGDPARVARIGQAARRFVEAKAGLDRFVSNIVDAVQKARAARDELSS